MIYNDHDVIIFIIDDITRVHMHLYVYENAKLLQALYPVLYTYVYVIYTRGWKRKNRCAHMNIAFFGLRINA